MNHWPNKWVEPREWQGARKAHTRRYVPDEQRRQSRWIGTKKGPYFMHKS